MKAINKMSILTIHMLLMTGRPIWTESVHEPQMGLDTGTVGRNKQTTWPLVHELTMPTERPPFVHEI
jgi:hypothetical protein